MNSNRSGEFNLTTTQRRLYELLQDGQPHSKAKCLLQATGKRFASPRLLAVHVSRMRPRLERGGQHIQPIEAFGYQLIKVENTPMPDMTPAVANALVKARALLASVTFDSDGITIGGQRTGGNGGLLSNDSIKAADQLRLALDSIEQEAAK